MQDEINAIDRATRDVEIGKVAFDEIDAGDVCEVLARAGDEAVDDTDLLAAVDELFRQVRSDEPGTAGYKIQIHAARCLSAIAAAEVRLTPDTPYGWESHYREGKTSQPADKPSSVRVAPFRAPRRDDHSSSPAIARRVQQPTRWLRTGRPL